VYQRALPDGHKRFVLHLLNLPSNGLILDQTEVPPVAQNVELHVRQELKPLRVACLDADDESLEVLTLAKSGETPDATVYRIPPFKCWAVIVIEGQ
jgi:hypothetical protein